MSIGFSLDASVGVSMITGIFPGPPGAGRGHPFELRAGPFFGGELKVVRLRGRERMNDVYRYDVTFVTSQPPELVTSAIFGMPACLTIKSPGNDPRVIQGIASSIKALGGVPGEEGSKLRRFALSIVPRLWLLRHRRQNRIFQNKTIPEIVSKVLAGAGIKDSDCHWRADRKAYPALPFVYQRAETDWDFFKRILASAGVFFFYEHASGFLDSMFGGAASAVAGAVGAAAGMIGGAVGSAVSTVESVAGMVPVLCFGDEAGHTAAVAGGLSGLADEAVHAGLGALAGAVGGVAGQVIGAVASAVEEPSDTLAFDDDLGSNAHVERVYEFELEKTLSTKELRMLDRDVERAESWVGVASAGDVSASINVSAGLSLAGGLTGGGLAGAVSAGASIGASFDVDAPAIPASDLRQELYQEDHAVWQDTRPPGLGPWVSLSAWEGTRGMALPQATVAAAIGSFNFDAARERRMRVELERTRRKYQEGSGKSDCRRVGAGYRFTLGRHPIKTLNREYTVTALDVEGIHPDFLEDGQAVYENRFRCIPSNMAARPKRPKRRPKPGMEVARVVDFRGGQDVALESNPAGYVRVRFRWDILDDDYATPRGDLQTGDTETDDVYSVWLPVVQPWAGAGYGAQFIPREGMEVLVGFLEDQSERPVILGCLYSNANSPPWPEYNDHQKVGIRSQTRPANGGWSEVSIDDRQGGEILQFRAQKDMHEDVLNDRITTIQHDRTTTVGHDSTLAVGNDLAVTVGHNQSWEVSGDLTTHVVKNSDIQLDGDITTTIEGDSTATVRGNYHRTVCGRIDATTEGEQHLHHKANYVERHGGHRVVVVGTAKNHRSAALHVEGAARVYASKVLEAVAVDGFTLTCGKSSISVTPEAIVLSSPKVSLVGKEIAQTAEKASITAKSSIDLLGPTISATTPGASLALDTNATMRASKVSLGGGSGSSSWNEKKKKVTKVKLADPGGKPLADARIIVRFGGKGGEERMVVLDEHGECEIESDDPFDVHCVDTPDAKRA
jgi:uncharacterized protein involved in type VI secretion and phage assembly